MLRGLVPHYQQLFLISKHKVARGTTVPKKVVKLQSQIKSSYFWKV